MSPSVSIFSVMPLEKIGQVIFNEWTSINNKACFYLQYTLRSIELSLEDQAKYHLKFFLKNAVEWQGPMANAIKNELQGRVTLSKRCKTLST